MVELRAAVAQDAAAIHRLLVASFTPFQQQYTPACFDATVLDAPRVEARIAEGPAWIAESDGAVVGTVSAKRDARGLYIRGLAVHPEWARMGIARRLLDAATAYGRAIDAPCLWLSTTTFLLASQALYKAAGFHEAPGPADLCGTPLVSFEKPLKPWGALERRSP